MSESKEEPCFVCGAPLGRSSSWAMCAVCDAWARDHDNGQLQGFARRVITVLARERRWLGPGRRTINSIQEALALPDAHLLTSHNIGPKSLAWLRSVQDWPRTNTDPPGDIPPIRVSGILVQEDRWAAMQRERNELFAEIKRLRQELEDILWMTDAEPQNIAEVIRAALETKSAAHVPISADPGWTQTGTQTVISEIK
jgi:hypothetical protein